MIRKKVLLTGASGFLGRITYNYLANNGYKVIPLVRHPSNFKNEIMVDLSKKNFISYLPSLSDFSGVVHLAAHIDFSSNYDPILFRINTLATYQLAKYVASYGIHFIFASMSTIYGFKTSFIDENSALHPDTSYALSKWLAEELIRKECPNHTILRLCGIYGKDGPEHLGLNRAIDQALKGSVPEVIGHGKAKRNYLFVEDAAMIVGYSLENKLKGAYFCGGPENLSISEMIETICDVFLDGQKPLHLKGPEASDQIVKNSLKLPTGRTLREALTKIKTNHASSYFE